MKKQKRLRAFGMRRVRALFRIISFERGEDHEEKVLRVFAERTPDVPEWFRSIRKGTMKQDFNKGIDFVIETDVGKIFLQVKSSRHFAKEFRRGQAEGRYSGYIAVVVLDDDSITDQQVRARILSRLSLVRNVFVERRHLAVSEGS